MRYCCVPTGPLASVTVLGGLARPAPRLRRQPLVHDPGQGEHALRQIRAVLQGLLDGVRHAAPVVGLGEARPHIRVVPFQYLREFGELLVVARRDNFGCGYGLLLLSSDGFLQVKRSSARSWRLL
jgi:hypothetical protein